MSTGTRLLLTIVLVILKAQLHAQCNITVNAGPDKTVCAAGGQTTLNGSITGNYLGFNWSPATGLSNPNILTPTATVTGPLTYTLSAQAIDPTAPNLVTNPAFELGNVGFTSAYTYNPTPITPGTYVLTTSPSLILANFPPCDDHTYGNGTGNMMLINGAGIPGVNVWCQTIPVTPNTTYVMSAWVASSPISPAQLQFSVNGTLTGNVYQASGAGCVWEQFSASWNSGSATSAILCIVTQNNANGLFGDDYALDDIYFAAACTVTDQVNVSVVTVNAVAPVTAILPCSAAATGIVLNGSASSSGPGYSYQWTTPDGNILSGENTPNATVNQEGNYTLTVTYNLNGTVCTASASTLVLPDPNTVVASAIVLSGLNCANPALTIDGGNSSSGPGITYQWVTVGGNIVTGANTQFPVVNLPGEYILTVTHGSCSANTSVIVTANFQTPTAVGSVSGSLTCTITNLTLSGGGSSTNNVSYLWTTANGTIVSGANTLNNCVVNAPGTYTLTVTNSQSFCTAVATVLVNQNNTPPAAVTAAPAPIDCDNPSVQLSGTGSSSGAGFSYLWTTANGNITGGSTTLSPTVNAPGTYTLTVTNSQNGCTASASATVTGNATVPVAIAGTPQTLDCNSTPVSLDGSGSSAGAGFSYFWTTANGNILSGDSTLMPSVNAPGSYILTVTFAGNGCVNTDTVAVTQDANAPTASASVTGQLDCLTNSLTIDGSGSSSGVNISFVWTTTTGNFISGQNTLAPEVNAPGIYMLALTNTANNCTASTSVTVSQDTISPTASIGPAAALDCISTTATLDGSGSNQGAVFSYLWSTANGNLVNGGTTLMPEIDAGGTYILTVSNSQNGCTASASVTATENTAPPMVNAGATQTLTCTSPVATLDGSASSSGANYFYQWTAINGNILSGDQTPNPEVNEPGTYQLLITNTSNGCTAADSVAVSQSADFPVVQIAEADTLNCILTQTSLSATANGSGTLAFLWSTANGNFVSGDTTLTPLIDNPGSYLLTVTDTQNGCTASTSVDVFQNKTAPQADAGSPFTLSCAVPDAMLDGSGSSSGNGFGYLWTTSNGNIVSGQNTLTPNINAHGTYALTVTDTGNGCTSTSQVIIQQDANAPTANAGNPATLTCTQASATLNGSASSSGAGITYFWSTTNGNIVSGAMTLTPTVNAPGTYLLTVTDTANNCQSLSSVQVLQNNQPPMASASVNGTLTCTTTSLTLNGSASGGNPLGYLWTTSNGNIVSGANSLMPVVNAAGLYTLTVTNPQNGCTATASATVMANTTTPNAVAAAPVGLTCTVVQVPLSGVGSSLGLNFSYLWTTQNGNIVSGATTLAPVVNAAGLYTLTVTNSQNGCTATATTTVMANTTLPVAMIASPPALGCGSSVVTLNGLGSSTGLNYSYLWTTQNGNIVSGVTTILAVVDAVGTYMLTVMNTQNGCTASQQVTVLGNAVPPVAVIAQPGQLDCIKTALTLDAGGSSTGTPYSYLWTTSNGNIVSGQNTLMPVVDAPGLYTLTITNTTNGCSATASVNVSQNITIPGADAGPDMKLTCKELQIALTGSSPTLNVNFHWSTASGNILFGETTPMPGVDAAGMYTLTVTNLANGCTSADSVTVTSVIFVDFFIQLNQPECMTGSGSIAFTGAQGGTAPFQFSIDGGATFSSISLFENLPPAVYKLTVLGADFCRLDKTVQLLEPPSFTVTLEPVITIILGDSWQMEPILSIAPTSVAKVEWTPAAWLDCGDCLRPVATPPADAPYAILVTDMNGCTATASTLLRVNRQLNVYVPNAFSPNGDGLNDLLMIFAKPGQISKVVSFKIFTRWGESVFAWSNFPPNDPVYGWDGTHRGKDLEAGVYAWFAEIELVDGEKLVLKGDVVLMR